MNINNNQGFLDVKEFNKKELEVLKEILPFYVINTIYEDYSYRSIPITNYGWEDNVWNTGILKDKLFYVANLNLNYNLFVVSRLDMMRNTLLQANMGDDFYLHRDKEKIVVYVNSRTNVVLSIFKHIRNALAHGRFMMYQIGDDYMFALESVDNSRHGLVVKARMLLKASTLLEWMKIIKKGPIEEIGRKRKKK